MGCSRCGSILWNGEACGASEAIVSKVPEQPLPNGVPQRPAAQSTLGEKLCGIRDHVHQNCGGYIGGAFFLLIFGGCGYFQFLDWRHTWRQNAAQAEEERQAQTALNAGEPEPMLHLLRGGLARLKQQRDSIERNPKHVFKTNRRTGVETRTEDLTHLLPDIYRDIASLEGRIAKIESEKSRKHVSAPEADGPAPKNADDFYKRGLANYQKREYHKAIKDFEEVVRLNSKDANAVILGYFAARQVSDDAAATRFVNDLGLDLDDTWPYPMVRFLSGQIDEVQLLMLSEDDDKKLEARCCLGLDHLLKGRKDVFLQHLRWARKIVTYRYSTLREPKITFCVYPIAMAELMRLEQAAK